MNWHIPENEEGIESIFVGRSKELDRLCNLLTSREQLTVVVQGMRGSGKTSLLSMFHHLHRDLFPGGYESIYGFGPQSPREILRDRMNLPLRERALLVIDDAHMMQQETRLEIGELSRENLNLRILIATHEPNIEITEPHEIINIGGFSKTEYHSLLSKRLIHVAQEMTDRLWASTEGLALSADLVSRTIRQNLLTWNEIFRAIEGTSRAGILGPNGEPINEFGKIPDPIIASVSEANEELFKMLRRDPSKFYSLSPRTFEEVVANLLSRIGYSVELTPASADGGFDIYAARKDGLGRFLYLVECKRYAPQHKVGVQIVRSLYGVVQQKRANAGIIVTTSSFTKGAHELQQQLQYQMHLQDYLTLQAWLK